MLVFVAMTIEEGHNSDRKVTFGTYPKKHARMYAKSYASFANNLTIFENFSQTSSSRVPILSLAYPRPSCPKDRSDAT